MIGVLLEEDLSRLPLNAPPLAKILFSCQRLYTFPDLYFRRIIETIHIKDSSVVRSVTMEVRLPPVDRAYVPIMTPRKGTLVDNLTIEESDGVSPWTLNRTEAKLLTSGMVQFITLQRLSAANLIDPFNLSFGQSQAVRWIGRTAVLDRSASQFRVQALRRIASGRDPSEEPLLAHMDSDGLQVIAAASKDSRLSSVLTSLESGRIMYVPVKPQGGVQKISYAFEAPHFENGAGGLMASIRTYLGFSPYHFTFDAPLALLTPSYHFRLRGPDGHYVRAMAQFSTRKLTIKAAGRGVMGLIDSVGIQGEEWAGVVEGVGGTVTNYAHVYFRKLYRFLAKGPQIEAIINERPAGTIGGAVFHSGLTSAAIASVLLLSITDRLGGGVDSGAIIIAVPTLAAIFKRPGESRSEYVVAPLTSRVAAAASLIACLVTAFLVVWSTNGVTERILTYWITLLAGMGIVFSWASFRLIVNIRRYSKLDRSQEGWPIRSSSVTGDAV